MEKLESQWKVEYNYIIAMAVYLIRMSVLFIFYWLFKISRNAQQIRTTVMLTLIVPTPRDHSTAHVTMVTSEMESPVMVPLLLLSLEAASMSLAFNSSMHFYIFRCK